MMSISSELNSQNPNSNGEPKKDLLEKEKKFGPIFLDISNSVIPLERLITTPSAKDGLSEKDEMQIRSLGCDLIQLAGKLLKLPQVAMATGCILFHRFFYAKSFIRLPFDIVAMSCLGLACKIEESPRRTRDIINVFRHIRQVRSGKAIHPVVLDGNYINLKNQIIKAERRVLKELGFCVHVKHPHKLIFMYLKWLEFKLEQPQDVNNQQPSDDLKVLQMSWNFMNDSLRTDVFVRYPPETIAVACIYLSARKLCVPLPKNPSWFQVLGIEEDDIKECCYKIICLYDQKKPNQDELEALVDSLRRKMDESRRAARENARGLASGNATPINQQNLTPPNTHSNSVSRIASPSSNLNPIKNDENSSQNYPSKGLNSRSRSRSPGSAKKRKKHHRRSRSRSGSYDSRDFRGSRVGEIKKPRNSSNTRGVVRQGSSRSRSRSFSPFHYSKKNSKKSHRDKRDRYTNDHARERKMDTKYERNSNKKRNKDSHETYYNRR